MTADQKVYVSMYTFPQEESKIHLSIFDNADTAIECTKKAVNNGSDWVFVDKREVQSELRCDDGMPEE